MFISTNLWDLLVTLVPCNLRTGFGDLTNHLNAVGFCALNTGQILCESSFLLCKAKGIIINVFIFSLILEQWLKQNLPTTVSIPEDLDVLASHSYSASSSNTALLMMRIRCNPLAIISYFLPFLISAPSLNQRTCATNSYELIHSFFVRFCVHAVFKIKYILNSMKF